MLIVRRRGRRRFIYVHVLRTGGDAIKDFLRDALCPGSAGECGAGRHDLLEAMHCARWGMRLGAGPGARGQWTLGG